MRQSCEPYYILINKDPNFAKSRVLMVMISRSQREQLYSEKVPSSILGVTILLYSRLIEGRFGFCAIDIWLDGLCGIANTMNYKVLVTPTVWA